MIKWLLILAGAAIAAHELGKRDSATPSPTNYYTPDYNPVGSTMPVLASWSTPAPAGMTTTASV